MEVNELASDNVERDSKGATAPLAGAGQSPAKVKDIQWHSIAFICVNGSLLMIVQLSESRLSFLMRVSELCERQRGYGRADSARNSDFSN